MIERDDTDGAGTADKACADPKKPDCFNCFAVPAKVKRIYKIEFNDAESSATAARKKVGYIDLMKIADPEQQGPSGF